MNLLLDDGAGGFQAATRHYGAHEPAGRRARWTRTRTAGSTWRCPAGRRTRSSVLVSRPPGPPAFSAAMRYAVGSQPVAAGGRRPRRRQRPRPRRRQPSGLDGVDPPQQRRGIVHRRSAPRRSRGARRPRSWPATSTGTASRTWPSPSAVNDEVTVLRGTGGGTFASVGLPAAGSGPDDLVAADVDGDGDLDLLVCDNGPSGTVAFLRNDSVSGTISFVLRRHLRRRPGPHSHLRRPPGQQLHRSTSPWRTTHPATRLTIRYGDGTGSFADVAPEILNLIGRRRQPDLGHRGRLRRGRRHRPGGHRAQRQRGERLPERRDELRPASHPDPRHGPRRLTPRRPDLNLDGKIDLAIAAPRPRGAAWPGLGGLPPSRKERASWPA